MAGCVESPTYASMPSFRAPMTEVGLRSMTMTGRPWSRAAATTARPAGAVTDDDEVSAGHGFGGLVLADA